MTGGTGRDHGVAIAATTEAPEIADGIELVRLAGIPEDWGSHEGDGLQVTVGDGRMATFVAMGPPHFRVFVWGYDTRVTRVARLEKVAGTVLRVSILDRIPPA